MKKRGGVPGPTMDVPTDLGYGRLSLAQFETERLKSAGATFAGAS